MKTVYRYKVRYSYPIDGTGITLSVVEWKCLVTDDGLKVISGTPREVQYGIFADNSFYVFGYLTYDGCGNASSCIKCKEIERKEYQDGTSVVIEGIWELPEGYVIVKKTCFVKNNLFNSLRYEGFSWGRIWYSIKKLFGK